MPPDVGILISSCHIKKVQAMTSDEIDPSGIYLIAISSWHERGDHLRPSRASRGLRLWSRTIAPPGPEAGPGPEELMSRAGTGPVRAGPNGSEPEPEVPSGLAEGPQIGQPANLDKARPDRFAKQIQ